MTAPLVLTRPQLLAYRRRETFLDQRLPRGRGALRRAAWAGLQDSMPRAALLSIHARMRGARPADGQEPPLVQVWGPRYSAYAVALQDLAVFTLGRLPVEPAPARRARETAERLAAALDGRRMGMRDAARAAGARKANLLRYAAPTGTVLISWDGARQPDLWVVPEPEMQPGAARLELARRYLHVFGCGTPDSFSRWAGVRPAAGQAVFDDLRRETIPVRTPVGDGWALARDEAGLRETPGPGAPARLLPSGDTWYLLQGTDRELLVPDARHRGALWTTRVWPGALLVNGETAGTWRRDQHLVAVTPWRRLTRAERAGVEAEAASLPLPGLDRAIEVRWERG